MQRVAAVGFGVVGLGSVSQRGLLPHLSLPDVRHQVRLVGVHDLDGSRTVSCAKRWQARGYDSYDEMLADPDVDAVAICTPIDQHCPQIRAALLAGKHVYTNKTMCRTRQEADELIALAAARGLIIAASPGQAREPALQAARTLIDEGAVGTVYWAMTSCCFYGHEYEASSVRQQIDPSWYYREPGGGPLLDMGVYGLHSLVSLFGPIATVNSLLAVGQAERRLGDKVVPVEAPDNCHLLLSFADNALVGHLATTFASEAWELQVHGSEGRLDLLDPWGAPAWRIIRRGESPVLRPVGPRPWSEGAHGQCEEGHVFGDLMDVVDYLRGARDQPLARSEIARHVIEVIEVARQAAVGGQRQRVTSRC